MTDRFRAGKRLWSRKDDALLRRRYPHEPNAVLARDLRRTVQAIYGRAGVLGLHKSAAYLAGPYACRLRRGDRVGLRFRFPKGHVPANKGTRRPGWSVGRMRETQFKTGHPGTNTMPIGATRLCDGYLLRKVSEIPHVPYFVNWKAVHILLWTSVHGPVPPGHTLRFINGDRADIRLDNLQLISRRENMARNTIHNLPEPLARAIRVLGALNRQIRKRTKAHEEQNRRSA